LQHPTLLCGTEIEHIGSTAVPKLAAKPIIDIMLGLSAPKEIGRIVAILETLGYQSFGGGRRPGPLGAEAAGARCQLQHGSRGSRWAALAAQHRYPRLAAA
jgi:GrpB-like predicted nucleotidyltransferase (UPF0157 family)